MNADPNRLERRSAQRFELHLPLSIHFDGRTVHGYTQDLSGRGIFFYAETEFPLGAVVELTFNMPSEITLTENMPVRCRGRVLRSSASQTRHSQDSPRSGIAVQLDSYEYLPSNEPIAQFARVSAASAAASGTIPR